MSRKFSWSDIPDDARVVLPAGIYVLEIAEVEERSSRSGKLMYNASFRVIEPAEHKGSVIFDNYTFGTDDDPLAERPETQQKSVGMRRFARLMKAAQLADTDDDMDVVCRSLVGRPIAATVTVEVDDGSRDPKYRGRTSNRIANMHVYGETPAATTPAPTAPKATTSGKPAHGTLPCGNCGKAIPREKYVEHIESNCTLM